MVSPPPPAWDLGRFWQTVQYFGALPGMTLWQQWWGQQTHLAVATVLLVGIPDHLRQGLEPALAARGYRVATLNFPLNTPDLSAHMPLAGVVVWTDLPPAVGETLIPYLPSDPVVFDFGRPAAALGDLWGALDDVVMGGVSSSGLVLEPGAARFRGTVSTANNGGFASVRTRNLNPALNLAGTAGLWLHLRGDGQRYKLLIRTDSGWDSLAYALSFDTQPGVWQTVDLPFAHFVPVFRAKTVPDAPPLDARRLRSFQVMLSKFEYDGGLNPHFQAGAFSLEIAQLGVRGRPAVPWGLLVAPGTRPHAWEAQLAEAGITAQPIRVASDLSQWVQQVVVFLAQ
ncbi:MAG: CIA30 family protein [Gloeomargaritaceae cyanobacterium C42_A2020_066]|nr:CIA30 family protein [Gloeomargaritaceae cyanobacterium C42_A2020_066]